MGTQKRQSDFQRMSSYRVHEPPFLIAFHIPLPLGPSAAPICQMDLLWSSSAAAPAHPAPVLGRADSHVLVQSPACGPAPSPGGGRGWVNTKDHDPPSPRANLKQVLEAARQFGWVPLIKSLPQSSQGSFQKSFILLRYLMVPPTPTIPPFLFQQKTSTLVL